VILVEGIFDYFAFYRLLQNQDKPVVVSTLGSYLSDKAGSNFKSLGVEHFIVAYDWDQAGRKGIEQIAAEVGGTAYYLGGMQPGQDPAEKLKGVIGSISGFSLKHLIASAKKHQQETKKPIHMSLLLEARHIEPQSDTVFTIPVKFLQTEAYTDLGPEPILWLRLIIEQQAKKRRIKQTDAVLAAWLHTTRKTILVYKRWLHELGYLNIDTRIRPQKLSVRYFPK
jgi:hypothetical protein